MASIAELRERLRKHIHLCSVIPAQDEKEQKQQDLIRNRFQVELECEIYRHNLRIAFLSMSTHKVLEETEKDGDIVKVRTVFNWEEFNERAMAGIQKRELNALQLFENEMKAL